jgi:hypothetical protein
VSAKAPAEVAAQVDAVEALVGAGQPAPGLVVGEVDPRVLVQVAGELAQRAVDQVEDVAVDLDAGDVLGPELQGGQDVAATADADDRGPVEVVTLQTVVHEVGDVAAQEVRLGGVAAVAGRDGPGGAVDEQVELVGLQVLRRTLRADPVAERGPELIGVAVDRHPREGVPAVVHVRVVALVLGPEDLQERGVATVLVGVADRTAEQQHQGDGGQDLAPPLAGVHGEQQCRQRGDRGDEDHQAGTVEEPERRHQHQAAQAGAHQVGRVEAVDPAREAGEREADDHAGADERDGDHDAGEHHREHGGGIELDPEGDRQLGHERDGDRHRVGQCEAPHLALHPVLGERLGPEVDDQRTHRRAEQGDRDGDEGEVVPHRHAEDAGQHDLVGQRREGGHEQAGVGRWPGP